MRKREISFSTTFRTEPFRVCFKGSTLVESLKGTRPNDRVWVNVPSLIDKTKVSFTKSGIRKDGQSDIITSSLPLFP